MYFENNLPHKWFKRQNVNISCVEFLISHLNYFELEFWHFFYNGIALLKFNIMTYIYTVQDYLQFII